MQQQRHRLSLPAEAAERGEEKRLGAIVHQTTPVQVWADVDVGIADIVRHLNALEGVRTHASCQGTIGQLSAADKADEAVESPPYVMVSWTDDRALERLETINGWVLTIRGGAFGYLHPTGTHWHTEWEGE